MKQLAPATLAHYNQSTTQIAELWRVTRTDNTVWGWTDHDQDVSIAGVTYRASEGLQATSAHATDTLQVDTLDVTAFLDVSTEADIAAGVWDGAQVLHAEFIWSDVPDALDNRVVVKRSGTLGGIRRQQQLFVAALLGLAHALQTRIGRHYSPLCSWYHAKWNGSTFVSTPECGIDLSGRIHDAAVSGLGGNPALEIYCSALALPVGYFDAGFVAAMSGANAGIVREIRRWENTLLSLLRPFPYAMQVGDMVRAVQGDDHTYTTCRDVFNNLAPAGGGGFSGDPFVPGQNALYASPIKA
jgi:uncharacterized phage protein (TIGR02218 family)